MTTSTTDTDWADRLVQHLHELATKKTAMADLRSGLRRDPAHSPRSHRYLVGFAPDGALRSQEIAVYATAALFAHHRDLPHVTGSLGDSLRLLKHKNRVSPEGVERRLQQLSRAADTRALARQLPGVLALLSTADAPLSWAQLARDLSSWDRSAAQISRRWFRDFYRHDATTDTSTRDATDSEER
jgi:CRISPR type I-E-associated protein CasB/Cse2